MGGREGGRGGEAWVGVGGREGEREREEEGGRRKGVCGLEGRREKKGDCVRGRGGGRVGGGRVCVWVAGSEGEERGRVCVCE